MKKIIFTGRLDGDSSLGAYHLCKIAPELARKYPSLIIHIIGGGTEFQNIAQISRKINQKLNRKLINTLGTQPNPTEFYDENTLFIGVSRAALEAMSRGAAAILLGNEGYLGLLDEDKLRAALYTNFTCRAHPICTPEELLGEIARYYSLPERERIRLSNLSKQIIQTHFTADQMAQKTLAFYSQIAKQNTEKLYHITLCGYYGRGNLGDEAILLVLKRAVKEILGEQARITVMNTKNPIKMIDILRHTDLFVFGGGSLLQNATSTASLFYYLFAILAADALSKNKIMLANGIGPLKEGVLPRWMLERLIARAVNAFNLISVRDTDSQKYLQKLLPDRKIHLVPDPALLVFENPEQKINQKLKYAIKSNYFIYIPCARGLDTARITPLQLDKILKRLEGDHSLSAVLCVLNPPEDKKVAVFLPSYCAIYPSSPNELCALLRGAGFVISQRYHGSLFSAACGVPVLSVSDDPKLKAVCKDFSLCPILNTEQLKNADLLALQVRKMLRHHENNEKIINILLHQNANRSQKAIRTILQKYSKK